MEGYRVMKAEDAARFADVWVTVTGDCNVIDEPAFKNMKDGAIICNSGHFDSEINMKWLRANAVKVEELKPLVEEYTLPDGRTITVLAEGRLVNLACAEGHPASVMDMSFANQALAAIMLWAAAAYLYRKHRLHWICTVPATFMTAVCTSYICYEPKMGFGMGIQTADIIGVIAAAICLVAFLALARKPIAGAPSIDEV